jgi:hypothetical protein
LDPGARRHRGFHHGSRASTVSPARVRCPGSICTCEPAGR